jgi:predicted ABC-type transport system involved in lysophospholipase L1 biosynthesis ATPase subunit
VSDALVRVRQLVKNYQALRPLRLQSFALEPADVVAIMGLDAPAAEMLVGLLTGAVLPDEGEVRLFGKSTREVSDSDAWLQMLDGVGIVTDRAVLIAQFTIEQNLAMPFTLQVDPPSAETRSRVKTLASAVGLGETMLHTRVAEAAPLAVARVRLARALALKPTMLLAEHPTASLPRHDVKALAGDIAAVAAERKLAVLALTGDDVFARALGGTVLTHEAATGALQKRGLWQRIFTSQR